MVLKGVLSRLKKVPAAPSLDKQEIEFEQCLGEKNMASAIVNSITFQFTINKRYGAKQERYA